MGVTADDRISTWGSFVSNGAGGSCFGKDIASLIYQLRRLNVSTKMLEASFEVNEYQKVYLVDRAINEADFKFNNKTVAVLGLAFKKHTNDMRDASSIKVVEALLGKGVSQINAYDPLANESAQQEFDPSKIGEHGIGWWSVADIGTCIKVVSQKPKEDNAVQSLIFKNKQNWLAIPEWHPLGD